MNYYAVLVRSSRYHGREALTYTSETRLRRGQIVRVELQKQVVPGVVAGPAERPRFQTKPVAEALDLPPLPAQLLKLAEWLPTYYPAPLGIVTQQLLPANFPAKLPPAGPAPDLPEPDLSVLPPLTAEQQTALAAMAARDTYLLHGVTGSGKTRLYIELAVQAVSGGASAIILTPEISLTTQLAGRFREVFGGRVIVMHSQQTPAERRTAWLACLRATEPVIVIGPRSALFSPVAKLGLIVLDEAHEAAYKQEQAPQYQTGRVAAWLAQTARATLVLGSATPSSSDYYLAEQKRKPIIKL
ncbi:MAG TPA: DEAD/DEAH box helicase, partial [Candidatus Saccharimonadales bacterium]|nr:DEAD/DEAH box helicase [Candidatus Saccharimonadales bacterium]